MLTIHVCKETHHWCKTSPFVIYVNFRIIHFSFDLKKHNLIEGTYHNKKRKHSYIVLIKVFILMICLKRDIAIENQIVKFIAPFLFPTTWTVGSLKIMPPHWRFQNPKTTPFTRKVTMIKRHWWFFLKNSHFSTVKSFSIWKDLEKSWKFCTICIMFRFDKIYAILKVYFKNFLTLRRITLRLIILYD